MSNTENNTCNDRETNVFLERENHLLHWNSTDKQQTRVSVCRVSEGPAGPG